MVELIESIDKALEGGFGVISTLPLQVITECLESKGFLHDEGCGETNGWQVDFWEYFNHPELGRWCLSGSLWYGDYKFAKQ